MRWWDEMRNPSLKCERAGHKLGVEFRKGYRRPDYERGEHRNYVCMGVSEERAACVRCRLPFSPWLEKSRDGFTGFSWPADQASIFNANGEYWTERGQFRASR
jgi:hypothetical protein